MTIHNQSRQPNSYFYHIMTYVKYIILSAIIMVMASCDGNSYDSQKVYDYYTYASSHELTNEQYSELIDLLEANIKTQMKAIKKIAKGDVDDLTDRRTGLQEYFRGSEGQNLIEAQRWIDWILNRNSNSFDEVTSKKMEKVYSTTIKEYDDLISTFYE